MDALRMQTKKFDYLIRGVNTATTRVYHQIQSFKLGIAERCPQTNHVLEIERLGQKQKHGGPLPHSRESREFRHFRCYLLRHTITSWN